MKAYVTTIREIVTYVVPSGILNDTTKYVNRSTDIDIEIYANSKKEAWKASENQIQMMSALDVIMFDNFCSKRSSIASVKHKIISIQENHKNTSKQKKGKSHE